MKDQQTQHHPPKPESSDNRHLVELMTTRDTTTAYNAINILQNNGIEAIINHELLSSAAGPAVGNPALSIIINEDDYPQALSIMREIGYMPPADMEDQDVWTSPIKMFSGKSLARQMTIVIIAIIVLMAIIAIYVHFLG